MQWPHKYPTLFYALLLVKKLLESCEITDFDYKHLNIFKMGKDSIQYTNIMKSEGSGS